MSLRLCELLANSIDSAAFKLRHFGFFHKDSFVHLPVAGGRIMSDYRIAILPGDGTGREVALEAQKILDTISQNTNIGFD